MSVLIDTNILLRTFQVDSPDHATAKATILALRDQGIELCIVRQVIYEYWVVATRPKEANGLGMTGAEAECAIKLLMEDFSLRLDERGIFGRWLPLVTKHVVKGKNAHDARLVAAMLRHGLTQVVTFNGADFSRYAGIRVISPADLVASRTDDF